MNDANPFDAPPVEAPAPPPNGARFLGDERAFWRLLIRGAALLFVTLGIYRFWLATDVRRFLWSNTEIAGDGLEYIGTARELLLGFLIAIVLLRRVNVLFFLAAFSGGLRAVLVGDGRRHARIGIPVRASEPRTLQDAQHLLAQSSRALRRFGPAV